MICYRNWRDGSKFLLQAGGTGTSLATFTDLECYSRFGIQFGTFTKQRKLYLHKDIENICSHINLYTACSQQADWNVETQKQVRCPSAKGWANKLHRKEHKFIWWRGRERERYQAMEKPERIPKTNY